MPLFPVSLWNALGQVGGVEDGAVGFLNQIHPACRSGCVYFCLESRRHYQFFNLVIVREL